MAELSQNLPTLKDRFDRLPKVWLTIVLVFVIQAFFDRPAVVPSLQFTAKALSHTGVFILIAVGLVAYIKAAGVETLLAKAFEGDPRKMIVMAAMLGGMSPFCSCEVIPFIAALLAVGAPLSAVMAFWLASPLMDPAMFTITWAEISAEFAVGKTLAAIGIGIFGGFATLMLANTAVFVDPLRSQPSVGGCCGVQKPFSGAPVWKFWLAPPRREVFQKTATENALFLLKWLTLAYVFEAMMVRYVPSEMIATALGGDGIGTVLLAALVGMPAYLNGYAAVGLIGGLLDQGMSHGAAMSFVIAGGVSSIPAAIAVWALVKPRVFAAYIGFAFVGALAAGLTWGWIA